MDLWFKKSWFRGRRCWGDSGTGRFLTNAPLQSCFCVLFIRPCVEKSYTSQTRIPYVPSQMPDLFSFPAQICLPENLPQLGGWELPLSGRNLGCAQCLSLLHLTPSPLGNPPDAAFKTNLESDHRLPLRCSQPGLCHRDLSPAAAPPCSPCFFLTPHGLFSTKQSEWPFSAPSTLASLLFSVVPGTFPPSGSSDALAVLSGSNNLPSNISIPNSHISF